MTALAVPAGVTHPIVNGRVLLPQATFTARNRLSGKRANFVYTGHLSETPSGELVVAAVDRRGNARSVLVASIVTVRSNRKRAS